MEDTSRIANAQSRKVILGPLPLLVSTAILAADQLTKKMVGLALSPGESVPESGFFRFTYVTNSGSAFGFFPNQTLFLILASFVGIFILVIFYRTHTMNSAVIRMSLGLQLGGAGGNLIDRIRLGYVVDFIDVGAWPVFNLADSAIVVGLTGLIWTLTVSKDGSQAKEKPGVDVALSSPDHGGISLGCIEEKDILPEEGAAERGGIHWEKFEN